MKTKIIAAFSVLVCFIALFLYIAKDWGRVEANQVENQSSSTAHSVIKGDKQISEPQSMPQIFETTHSKKTSDNKPIVQGQYSKDSKIDPKLKSIKIESVVVEDPEEAFYQDPQRLETVSKLRQFTMPIKNIMLFFPSFAYTGEMELEVPSFTNRRDNYDGENYIVKSKFRMQKDDEGDFKLYQTSESNSKKNVFSAPIYNGSYYFVDGETEYYDLNGNQFFDDKLSMVNEMLDKENGEPLVRKKWIEIITDIQPVIDLELISEAGETATWNIVKRKDIDNNNQKIILDNLIGTVTVRVEDDVLTSAKFSGSGTYQEGFMKGATVSWKISLNLTQIGTQGQVYLP